MRRKVSVRELIIIAVILLFGVTAFILLSFKKNGRTALIYVDGKPVTEIELKQEQNKTFTVSDAENIIFEVNNGKVRVVSSDCPDKVCCNTGFISKSGESIICMPNKMIVEIKD
ncbi:MAG: NusG domain II-containing protein [Oscillospiraceae bacterium]|nr:NusG domain II-containing protein [Oscillospiraceae bacterium]